MKVSVAIPTFNSAATVRATLESVLAQTNPPSEIIVLDDGSADETTSIVRGCGPRITLHCQKNRGVAHARNMLCKLASGDLIAFLDHDDLWHPRYLEIQSRCFEDHPAAGALFTGHMNFTGFKHFEWTVSISETPPRVDVIDAFTFFVMYNKATGPFGSMSYCCLPKTTIADLGTDPFRISGVDDSYMCYQVALAGKSVVYSHAPLVAYRLTHQGQSDNKLRAYRQWVEVFESLETRFCQTQDTRIYGAFKDAFAARRRSYGKVLMGCGQCSDGREQFRRALQYARDPFCFAKSAGLLTASYLPDALQPAWPSSRR